MADVHGPGSGTDAPIEAFAQVGSTNDLAGERARAGAVHGHAVRADEQLAGRGQRGHGWTSPGGGLYLSVVLRPPVPERLLPGLPAACGVGVVRALQAAGAEAVRLKWPNDVVQGSSKLAGVLVEGGWVSGAAYAVCGVGVNCRTPHVLSDSPGALAPTGLDSCLPARTPLPGLDELARLVRDGIVCAVDEWATGLAREACRAGAGGSAGWEGVAPLDGFEDAYRSCMAYLGCPVELITKEGAFVERGELAGVDACGRVLVRAGGGMRAFDSTDVSLRPLPAGQPGVQPGRPDTPGDQR